MDSTRRVFFEMLAAVAASPALMQPASAPATAGRAMASDDGELCFVGAARDPVRLKVSAHTDPATRLAMIVQDVSPGTVIPVHLHEREDEIILVQSGSGVASLGDVETPVGPGSVLWVPKGTWHGGRNTGSGILKWTGIYSPPGFEGYFREISRPPRTQPRQRSAEAWEALDRRYGIRYRR
jgi:mannose-6-phosphate isomerase-like protein (cupin superfamily)